MNTQRYRVSPPLYLAMLAAFGRAWHEQRPLRLERWHELLTVLA